MRSKKLKRLFLKSMLISLFIIIGVIAIGATVLWKNYNKIVVDEDEQMLATIPVYNRNELKEQEIVNKNIAVFGVDKEGARTDVILVVHFNSEENKVKVIAVPRDTRINWSVYQQDKMKELGRKAHTVSKITEMSAYGSIDNLRYFTINSLEEIMGIKIDDYIVINTEAFRKIVDAVGGVEVNVPRKMEYTDSSQGLLIDLDEGLQMLDGSKAEGFVRWRHNNSYSQQYAQGDIGRIETQKLFLKALAQKVLQPNILNSLDDVLGIIYEDIRTNIKLDETMNYLKYAQGLQVENIEFHTLPGESEKISGIWYYIVEEQSIDSFMSKVLYENPIEIK